MPDTTGETAVVLREIVAADLPIFFAQQLDPEANWMAAFTAADPADRAQFDRHWAKILADETIVDRTVVVGDAVVGHVAAFQQDGKTEVTYWLGREHWGRGIATAALAALLDIVARRPVYGRVAADNLASRRVLEKCGFVVVGDERGFAQARGATIEELVLRLDAPARAAAS